MRYVRYYVQNQAGLGNSSLAVPVFARTFCLLDFEVGNPVGVPSSRTGLTDWGKSSALVGPETYVQNQLLLGGNVEHFAIHLEPLALNHLFRLPVLDLTN